MTARSLAIAVEPLPVEWLDDRTPLAGGAVLHFEINGAALHDRAVAAGAARGLVGPRIDDAVYFDYLEGRTPGARWSAWERKSALVLLAGGRELAGEITYCARIVTTSRSVTWDCLGEYAALPPEDLSPGVAAVDARLDRIVFDRDQYLGAVRAARAIFDAVALNIERLSADPSRSRLNELVRRVRVVQALLRADAESDVLARINLTPANARQRRRSCTELMRAFAISVEPARAILASHEGRSEPGINRDALESEKARLVSEIQQQMGTLKRAGDARLRVCNE